MTRIARMKLIEPNREQVKLFNALWTDSNITKIKLFENAETINVTEYEYIKKCINEFSQYESQDNEIIEEDDLKEFLEKVNETYHTRVNGIAKIVGRLKGELKISSKMELSEKINEGWEITEFIKICKECTGKYTYSYATKVFSFVDDRYPIIDSIVATLLYTYLDEANITISKSLWGDYSKYKEAYNIFVDRFDLRQGKVYPYKDVDKFLWTYGKLMEAYWIDMGAIRFSPVMFNSKTIA